MSRIDGALRIQLERILPFLAQRRIVAHQRPVTGLHGQLLLLQSMHQVVPVRNATGVGNNQRRTFVRFGLLEGLHHVAVVAAQRHLRHINRPITNRFHGQVFSAVRLACRGKLGYRAARCGLRHLPAGIRVNLGIQHQHVHILARPKHVVQSAEADVERPSVAAQNPHALAHQ